MFLISLSILVQFLRNEMLKTTNSLCSKAFIAELEICNAEMIPSFFSPFSSQLGGLALLGIGIWVKVDGDSFEKILGVAAPQMMLLLHVGYLCITVGSILFTMGFLGCWGAVKERRCLLLVVSDLQKDLAMDQTWVS